MKTSVQIIKGEVIKLPLMGKDENSFVYYKSWLEVGTKKRSQLPIYFWDTLLYSKEVVDRERTGEDWKKVSEEIIQRSKKKIESWKTGEEVLVKGFYWVDKEKNNLVSFTITDVIS
jgi:hypothetical protein